MVNNMVDANLGKIKMDYEMADSIADSMVSSSSFIGGFFNLNFGREALQSKECKP